MAGSGRGLSTRIGREGGDESMKRYSWILITLVLAVGIGAITGPVMAGPIDDSYLAGYATAVLDKQFGPASRTVTVRDGVATVSAADLAGKHDETVKALSSIKGISRVEMIAARPGTPGEASARTRPETGRLPGGYLFNPLIADPRWPHFSLSYQRYINDRQLGNIGSVGLGESFTFYRDELGPGFWEVGIQAGVFALFDMDAVSKDLINADYFGAVFAAYRVDRFSTFARLFHQSSHLGDEFLLRNTVERINLSYEGVDVKLSYDLGPWLSGSSERGAPVRLYGGAGYLIHREPGRIKPLSVQYGLELRSPWVLTEGIRPILAADFQHREENDWSTDISIRAGVQFEGLLRGRTLQLMLEWFQGHSPNGQFYKQRIDYLSLGAHFHF
jgi:uncharacterized protein DUF1207